MPRSSASGRSRTPCAPASETPCAPPRCPIAEPPPVGGHTGATSDPTIRSFERILSASRLQVVVGRVDADVRIEEKQIDAVEPGAVRPRLRRSGRASCRDRSAARRPGRPCRPGPATSRCEAGFLCISCASYLSGCGIRSCDRGLHPRIPRSAYLFPFAWRVRIARDRNASRSRADRCRCGSRCGRPAAPRRR